jgi:hypothetical protein
MEEAENPNQSRQDFKIYIMKRSSYYLKILGAILITLFIATIVNAQKPVDKPKQNTTTKTAVKPVNNAKPKIPVVVPPKTDTIQLSSNMIAEALKGVIQRYMKNNFFNVELYISSEYPIEISLTLNKEGTTSISNRKDSITISGNITLKTNGSKTIIAFPKTDATNENSRPKMMINGAMVLKDYPENGPAAKQSMLMFTTSGSSINSENTVQSLKPGNFECSGYFLLNNTIPIYFESGTIIFTDNDKPCNFSEGSIFSFNSVIYKYTNLKWVKN